MSAIQDLGAHLVPAMVGVGMATAMGACIAEAMRMNRRLHTSSAATKLRIHALRMAMLLIVCVLAFVPFIYLLVEARISGTQAAAMLAGIVAGFAVLVRERVLRPKEFS